MAKKKKPEVLRSVAFTAMSITTIFHGHILRQEKMNLLKTDERIIDLSIKFVKEHENTPFFEEENRYSPDNILENWVVEELRKFENTPKVLDLQKS